ncbi:MAG: hypothetical protein ABI401_10540 [Candidatus Dormibacter sp.]
MHFDLQMKNFAAWDSAEDRTFAAKFRKLLNLEAGPIREKLREEGRSRAEAQAFDAMSRSAQVEALVKGVRQAAADRDLEVWLLTNSTGSGVYWTGWFRGMSVLSCRAWRGTCLDGVQFIVHHRFNKAQLDRVAALVRDPQFNLQVPLQPVPRRLSRVFDLTVVVSLESLPLSRVRGVLPSFESTSSADRHMRQVGREDFIRRGVPGYRIIRRGEDRHGFIVWTGKRSDRWDWVPSRTQQHHSAAFIATSSVPRAANVVVIDAVKSLGGRVGGRSSSCGLTTPAGVRG